MNIDEAIDLTGDDVPTVGAKRQRPPYGEILLRGRKLIDVAEGEHLNKLASIFTNAAVLAACRAECRVHLSAGAAAQRFTISRRGLPLRVYQGDELQRITLAAAFAGPRGRLHLAPQAFFARLVPDGPCGRGPEASLAAWLTAGSKEGPLARADGLS